MKKYYIIIFLLSLISLNAQNFIFKGVIKDNNTLEPIKGAIVYFSNNYYYSNSEGVFKVTGVQKENYILKISHLGYKTEAIELDLSKSNEYEKEFYLTPTLLKLDDVVVTTNKSDKSLRLSPGSENLIDVKQIQSKPFQSLPDAIKNEAGISIIKDGVWGTDVNIRGLSKQNIVTLIDGNRIETATDLSARLSMIDLNDVEKIEVIKGASSTIYGTGATGGVVNVISKSPQFSDNFLFNGSVSTGINSVNNSNIFSGNIQAGSSFWSSKITASYRKAGNIKTPIGELKNSQFKDYSISAALNIIPFEEHLLKFNFQNFKAEDVGIPGASALFPSNADVRYPVEKRRMISAEYEIHNISNFFKKLILGYTNQYILREVENIPYIVQNLPTGNGLPARRVSVLKITPGADHNYNGFKLQGNFNISENNILVAGIDLWNRAYKGHRERYQKIEVLNAQNQVVKTTNKIIGDKPLPDSRFTSLGFFAQDDYVAIKDKLFFTFGARVDKINIKGDETLTPIFDNTDGVITYTPAGQKINWAKAESNEVSYSMNFGTLYSVSKTFDLSLNLGYSFRAPSLEERFQYIDLGNLIRLGNPDLKSEKGQFLDFGIRYYGDNFKIKTSTFYNYMTDLVVEENGTFENKAAKIKKNVGKAHLYGFDLTVDYNFIENLLVYTNLSYVVGRDLKQDSYLPEIPAMNATIGIKTNIINLFETELSSSIFAEQNNIAPGEISTPGYAVFNIAFNSRPISLFNSKVRLNAGVENIFNKNYRNHLSTARGVASIEPGRNFYFVVALGF